MGKSRPFVRLKIAGSLDGRTALANGDSKWITGKSAREKVHELRSLHGAIITGIGTVLADDPSLNARPNSNILNSVESPLRVILDSNLSTPINSKMLKLKGRTLIMTTKYSSEASPNICDSLIKVGAEIIAVSVKNDRLHIPTILSYLQEEESVNEVMVEAGAVIAGSFISEGVVDELHVFCAPSILGHEARPMFNISNINNLDKKIDFEFKSTELLGKDLYSVLTPKN